MDKPDVLKDEFEKLNDGFDKSGDLVDEFDNQSTIDG